VAGGRPGQFHVLARCGDEATRLISLAYGERPHPEPPHRSILLRGAGGRGDLPARGEGLEGGGAGIRIEDFT
jgi:hypothetical protein